MLNFFGWITAKYISLYPIGKKSWMPPFLGDEERIYPPSRSPTARFRRADLLSSYNS